MQANPGLASRNMTSEILIHDGVMQEEGVGVGMEVGANGIATDGQKIRARKHVSAAVPFFKMTPSVQHV